MEEYPSGGERMGRFFAYAVGALSIWPSTPGFAHSIKQQLGAYTDNKGMTRQRVGYDINVEAKPPVQSLTAASIDLTVARDRYRQDETESSDYDKKIYGGNLRTNDRVSANLSETWNRLTDTRLVGAYASDGKIRSRTYGAGASTWIHHETVRLSFDVTRTILEQPLYQVLDLDFQEVGNPTVASSAGATVGVRHLATPTTILDYTASHVVTENRPDTNVGAVSVRQFVRPLDGAVHGSVTRAVNRGYVATDTTYGQVDAWIYEVAWLENLWQGARARAGYRYYKEDETTRAYQDETELGTDTASLSFAQDLPKTATNLGVPLTLDASAARFVTNVAVQATAFEFGVTAKF